MIKNILILIAATILGITVIVSKVAITGFFVFIFVNLFLGVFVWWIPIAAMFASIVLFIISYMLLVLLAA